MTRVLMLPHVEDIQGATNGIARCVEAYFKYLPEYGVELVGKGEPYDLKAVHAGLTGADPEVGCAMLHGLYWADYDFTPLWEHKANQNVIAAIRHAKEVTVPSAWVAETFQRDMHFTPTVVGHGIEWDEWQHNEKDEGYVLWNKNRNADVCDPVAVGELATRFPGERFMTTFVSDHSKGTWPNVWTTGVVDHKRMKEMVQRCAVYLATTKETFGIGILEAMAAGKPILGFAQGGILETVRHGINGYLAQPGDYEDLAAGLVYCLEHRRVLGDNGKLLAREFTWQGACEKLARVYERAMRPDEPTVAITIPSFKYSSQVGRAIESAIAQTYNGLTNIVVVDDGSDDEGATEAVVKAYTEKDTRVRYLYQNNQGVARARNTGIAAANTKYACCVDADDALDPTFLEACIQALEADRSLGIAYTGLQWVKKDGSTGISEWPGPYNYDEQLKGHNQVPTACVFRRVAWQRANGYDSRYCPHGAGSEDAEFWTRLGALGFGGKKVTEAPLFIYSWETGRVSGDKQYREINWLEGKPYVKDGQHPFASVATPANHLAHPVRQYDQPAISVIIPVGPGHEREVVNAIESLESQTFRKWECIVIDDTGGKVAEHITSYPFVRLLVLDGSGHGAGYARNRGVEIARAQMITYLDADDWFYPQFLEKCLTAWNETGGGVYTDYVGKAMVGDPKKLAQDLQERVYQWDGTEAVIGYKALEYDCAKAQLQPELPRPYLWCNISTLIPKSWHTEIGGFDESMTTWEDIDYWWRMARAGKCFTRVPEELLVYRFYTGSRRDLGVGSYAEVCKYLKAKYEGGTIMGCGGCGRHGATQHPAVQQYQERGQMQNASVNMQDENFRLCNYLHPNIGQHSVVGGVTKIKYGYRGGGERFFVHADDIKSQPHLFEPVPVEVVTPTPTASAPVTEAKPTVPPPVSLVEKAKETEAVVVQETPKHHGRPKGAKNKSKGDTSIPPIPARWVAKRDMKHTGVERLT